MDTLTHTLAGILLGECAARALPEQRSAMALGQRRSLYIGLLAVGSNLPDSDFVYSLITGSKLDYLLHHRGHSHTVVGVLVAAMLLFAFAAAWLKRARWSCNGADLRWLGLWALLAPVLHVTMDSSNTYGVHPFWPFSDRWWYGDSVFIIEPLLWVAFMPVLGLVQSNWLRLLLAAMITAALALLFGSELIPMPIRMVIVLAMLVNLLLGHFTAPRSALVAAVVSWCGVTLMFLVAHRIALRTVDDFIARTDPRAVTFDRILTPLPSNPLCWEVLLVQQRSAQYTLRRATLALAPTLLSAVDCPNRDLDTLATAPLQPVREPQSDQWQWFGEFVSAPGALTALLQRCEAAAFMKFARAPWWSRSAAAWRLGDLRYDREPGASFGEIDISDATAVCPAHLPPWRPPRSDLLRAVGSPP